IGLDEKGAPREDGFDITAASEVMAVLCLAKDVKDLKERLARMVVAYTLFGKPVTVKDLNVQGAMAAILVEAFNPNLVQTTEGVPAFVHGGPFANIAHGCNSLIATKTALKLSDIVVTEAGFGADLGAEKFFDIVCRQGGLSPQCVVLVATVRALRYHGGAVDHKKVDLPSVERGFENLEKQIENIRKFNLPLVVALNRFDSDSEGEIEFVLNKCKKMRVRVALSDVYAKGGEGGMDLAKNVVELLKEKRGFKFIYDEKESLKEKIERIAVEIYGAEGVLYTESAEHDMKQLDELGFKDLPVCVSKTQMSLSDNKNWIGRPHGFKVTVHHVKVSAGAGFYVVLMGDIVTMPGLPKVPAAENVDVTDEGEIIGLF
ncbi:MAG: formate--tetrahydrofolate ligase, partial [Candidatus Altiarchaeota archaeon]|nr:formate--tetrahydrofolate ligase [Candidatus Altiarchaeota archaeon]